jgi:hypothetical protein
MCMETLAAAWLEEGLALSSGAAAAWVWMMSPALQLQGGVGGEGEGDARRLHIAGRRRWLY